MRTFSYKTLKGLIKACGSASYFSPRLTLEEVVKGVKYNYNRDECVAIKLSAEAENEFFLGIAKVLWKKNPETKLWMLKDLKGRSSKWYMQRLYMNPDGRFEYCAGQEYTSEIKSIQKDLIA